MCIYRGLESRKNERSINESFKSEFNTNPRQVLYVKLQVYTSILF